MDEKEIDEWIEDLGSSDHAIENLEEIVFPSWYEYSGANTPEEAEIDHWIRCLGSSSARDHAIEKLEAIGEPALHRLYQVLDGKVSVPFGGYPRDASTNRSVALGSLGARYPETLLALVQGKTFFRLALIEALGFTGDPRLKEIAKEALKNFMND